MVSWLKWAQGRGEGLWLRESLVALVALETISYYMLQIFICGLPGLSSYSYLTLDPVELLMEVKERREQDWYQFLFFSFFKCSFLWKIKGGPNRTFFHTRVHTHTCSHTPTVIEHRRENSSKQNCSQTSFYFSFQWLWFSPLALIKVFKEAQKWFC